MRSQRRIAFDGLLAVLVVCMPLIAGLGPQGEEIPLVPAAASPEEFDAMDAMEVEQNPVTQLTLATTFLDTYPESEFTHLVERVRIQAYTDIGNSGAVILAAEAALEAETGFVESRLADLAERGEAPGQAEFELNFLNSRTFYYRTLIDAHNTLNRFDEAIRYGELALANDAEAWERYDAMTEESASGYAETLDTHRSLELYLTQIIMNAYQNLNDAENTIAYAERALELSPRDLATLITISGVMAERPPDEEAAREQHLEQAEAYARDAIELLEEFLSGPAGGQIGAEQAAGLRSGVHSTLGLIYLHQQEYGDAQDEYETALDLVADDPVSQFRLGVVYARDDELDEALEALARSVFLGGVTESEARGLLERIYEARNGSLDGLEGFIATEGARLGNE